MSGLQFQDAPTRDPPRCEGAEEAEKGRNERRIVKY